MSIFRKRIWQDRIYTLCYFYKSPKFALIDLAFGLIALFINPYRTCRKFLQKKGEKNIYAYGETPYATYERIALQCGIGPNDTWLELGSGRGKGCFWLSHFTGCKVIGIEWIGQFVFFAKLFQKLFIMNGIEFQRGDIQKSDLDQATIKATVIYLYGLWPNLEIRKGVKVITTGEPMEGFRVIKSFWVRFPWGRTTAFLQEK